MRTRTMVIREAAMGKESSHREESSPMDVASPPLTNTDIGMTISSNIDQPIQGGTNGIDDSAQMDKAAVRTKIGANIIKDSVIEPSSDADMNGIDSSGDDETSTRISEPASAIKFQPLQPISEKAQSNLQENAAMQTCTGVATKESGSFMNNIQDPVAASKIFKKSQAENDDENLSSKQQMSHTPPTSMSTSYESMHFGKRPRSGSLSERLLVSTELQEKGIINRDQKGILKDLIISGQDNEIQHALDRYEQGDATMLEGMLHSGSLSNKATEEIDLLGQLDFDFLNVKEKEKQNDANDNGYAKSSSIASDGIGELEFDGGIGNWEQGENNDNRSRSNSTWSALESRTRANSTWSALELALQQQQRSRANSAMSIDLDNFRSRSNSLFSPLIGNQTPDSQANFGRWMESSSGSAEGSSQEQQQEQQHQHQQAIQQHEHQHHFQQLLSQQKQKKEQKSKIKGSKPARRKSAPSGTRGPKTLSAAAIAKEQMKEQKRKERQLKKEQKEKEKQEKKELKERAKREKQKKKEGLEQQERAKEKEIHVPGSGRPRSMSDPNLKSKVREDGLLEVERPDGWIGAYSPESRKVRISRFLEKRNHRVWTKTVKYDVRKNFADSRLRVKGRFVKKDDELLMRELMSLT